MMRGVRKRGNKYFIDFYSNGQRVREVVGTSQKQAEDALRKRKTEVIEGKFFDKRKEQRIRFADEADEYYKMHSEVDLKPTSRDRDFTLLKNLKAYFGNQYLHTITAKDIEAYKKKRIEDKVTGATINRELSCLRSLYNRAIAGKKIIDSPMKTVKMFPEPKGRLRFLEKEEIPKLLNACSEHLRPIVITALFTGMRRSEVLGLRWRDIDIKRNLIYLYNTKNGERREVPMNDVVKKTLISVPKNINSEYIFCAKDGRPFYNVRKSFATALKDAEINDFTFHGLRHSYASHLVMSGIDLMTVKELLGHKSIEMTMRYSHLAVAHKQHAVEILEKNLGTNWAQTHIDENSDFERLIASVENKGVIERAPVAQMDRAQVS